MTWTKAYQKRHAKASHRHRRTAHERLARDQRQAQQTAEALQQALDDLGLSEGLCRKIAFSWQNPKIGSPGEE
jgi:DNA-directed RNA polymerase subunit N (RpoN/RPB10)